MLVMEHGSFHLLCTWHCAGRSMLNITGPARVYGSRLNYDTSSKVRGSRRADAPLELAILCAAVGMQACVRSYQLFRIVLAVGFGCRPGACMHTQDVASSEVFGGVRSCYFSGNWKSKKPSPLLPWGGCTSPNPQTCESVHAHAFGVSLCTRSSQGLPARRTTR